MTEHITAPAVDTTALGIPEAAKANAQNIAAYVQQITQREWFGICRSLEAPKSDILADPMFLMPTLLWVKRKRDGLGTDWEHILELTDEQLMAELGVVDDEPEPAGAHAAPKEPASEPAPVPTGNASGDVTEPEYVSPSEDSSTSTPTPI